MLPRISLISLLGLLNICVFGQDAPGGVNGSSVWYHPEDESAVLGNHHTFNLLDFASHVEADASILQNATTYFFVFKPEFTSSSGAASMTLGGIEIYDDRIVYNGITKTFNFTSREPKIIAITAPPRVAFGRRASSMIELHDSSLFSMAEVLIYPDRLNRWEIHKVNSYLALKYSISITQNTDARWRYYHKADSSLYWSSQIDRYFDQRVVGLGNSDDERFDHTQSTVSSGDFMLVALDTVKPIGQMPSVPVAEDAFIVFSERLPQAVANLACPFDQSTINPLRNWKFVLYNWSSSAQTLKVRYARPKGALADSLFLWDGNQYWHLPVTYLDSVTVEYTIYFDMLQSGRHYFFVQRTDLNCPNLLTTLDPSTGMLKVDVDDDASEEWTFETTSLKTGVTTSETIANGTAWRQLEDGQYLVRILDSDGNEIGMRVVSANTDEIDVEHEAIVPDIRLYPNPVAASQVAKLFLNDLPSEESIQVVINDSYGKILSQETMDYHPGMEIPLSFPVVGHYQVTVQQGQIFYSIKAIVLQ